MWEKGISAYLGLNESPDRLYNYLEQAKRCGYSRLFTSLHIPEAKAGCSQKEIKAFIQKAASLGYQITADISAGVLTEFGASYEDLSALTDLGLTTLRLDYGFTPEQIAAFTRKHQLEIELNASTITEDILIKLAAAKTDFTKVRACHNYYPRPETGLAMDLFMERSKLLRRYGILVFAFIPSKTHPRPPLAAGLPTLEKHRNLEPVIAAKEFLATGLVAGLLFGDPLATDAELTTVAALSADSISFRITTAPTLSTLERQILFSSHQNRFDPGENVVRSQKARSLASGPIPPTEPRQRLTGSITIDNDSYLRYKGELQIVRSPLPADSRVNVVAQIIPEEQFLLSYLKPGGAFQFEAMNQKQEESCHEA
ncbi:MAG: MupG family TIM beta-alpha barrel fold protein [Sporomusaceae bacterium]|nr:MupG family TIM beta-alpha barrel fold protein [Sporomusaceae bacterium]